jgi:PAS domain S-box-containing protein
MTHYRFAVEIARAQELVRRMAAATSPEDRVGHEGPEVGAMVELGAVLHRLASAGDALDARNEELIDIGLVLEREREQYRDLFESAPGAYLVTDERGLIRQASEQTYQLLGLANPRRVLGRPLRMFVDPVDRHDFSRRLGGLADTGQPRRWQLRIVPNGGPGLAVAAHVLPVHLGDGAERWEFRWLLIPVDPEQGITQRVARRGFVYEMADALGIGAYVTDADGTCVYANRRSERILGERVVGTDMAGWPARFEEHRPPVTEPGAEPFDWYLITLPDGERRWVAHRSQVLRNHAGEPDGVVGTLADVTHMERAEELSRAATERLEGILAEASDAIISADEDQVITSFNPAAEALLGYQADDVLGRSLASILPDEAADPPTATVDRFGDQHEVQRLMGDGRYVAVQRASGERFTAEISISEGTVLSKRVYVAILRDVSAQVAAAEAILRSDRRYRAVFDQSMIGLLVVDASGVVIDANRAFCELVDQRADEIRGHEAARLVDEPSAIADRCARDRSVADGFVGYRLTDQRYRRADGSFLWADVAVSSVRDPDGKGTYLVYLIDDTTGQHEMEAQLHHAQRIELAAQLGSGLAHDLNNVLTVLRGQLELLGDEIAPNPRSTQRLVAAHRAVDRASGVASGLLGLSRKPEYEPQVVDLNELVRAVSELTGDAFGDGIELSVELGATAPDVLVDVAETEQVLITLVVNARDAMAGGGSLRIRTSDSFDLAAGDPPGADEASPAVALSVIDTGIGMDAGTQAQVFTPYFTTKPVGAGTGLGLSRALQVVRRARGSIDVESRPGRGSTFTVTLPRAPDTSVLRPAARVLGSVGQLGERSRPVVLVVDDDDEVLDVVAETLDRAGYEVLACSGVADALRCVEARADVGVVLTDLVMPGGSGLVLATQLRAQHRATPIIFASAHFGEAVDRSTLEWSIEKPFTTADLLDVVGRAVAGAVPAGGRPQR